MVDLGGDVSIINAEEAVCSFHMGMGLFQRAPSSSPIKGGHIPPHFNNTQERKSTKEVEEKHHSNGLRP
jgi:hypothetical protein